MHAEDSQKLEPERQPAAELSGAEIIVRTLAAEEVEVVFGYSGGAVLPVYDALFKQNQLRLILVRHEQATRNYAKRQLTWFRNQWAHYDVDNVDNIHTIVNKH